MSKPQLTLIFVGFSLFCLLYFGFSPKPKKIATIESERVFSTAVTDINNLIRDVQKELTAEQKSLLITLEKEIEGSENESNKLAMLKRLSGKWFEYGQPHIAGFYAEQVADIENTEEAWSITGTTYATAFRMNKTEKIKEYALNRATNAFESAISLAPEAIQPKVNLALCYVEYPPKNNPMKGILQLIELNKSHPNNPLILTNLGRLAIQTGQYEKAIERLEQALAVEPNNKNANCLLAKVYKEVNNIEKADFHLKQCDKL